MFPSQVVDDLNMKNTLLQSNIDELNKEIVQQAQQLTGIQIRPSHVTKDYS